MTENELRQLKSGTDIRGVAVDGLADYPLTLTDEAVRRITAGFAVWLARGAEKAVGPLRVSVGHDSRITSEHIRAIVVETLEAAGMIVLDCGLSSTPAMFMTTVDLGCDGAVQITASHHPYYRNGLKFFTRKGGLDGTDIDCLLDFAVQGETLHPAAPGSVETVSYMNDYCERLRRMICEGVNATDFQRPLRGFHIVVDAGNGVGGFYAEKVLLPLGADISGSVFLEPDGMFPNHVPNPENAQAMASISRAVTENHADFGVIFDTDVDRAACVDAQGNEINKNRFIALASRIATEGVRGATIVTDSTTSDGLKKFIEHDLGGVHHRFKRGYRNVINEAIRLNLEGIDCPLAMETSGHAALRENYFLDDGAYLVTKLIVKLAQLGREGKSLDDLIATLKEPAECQEIRLNITAEDFRAAGNRLIAQITAGCEKDDRYHIAPDNHEGIRVSFGPEDGDGWFLVRLSVHDPVIPINIESNRSGGCRKIAQMLLNVIGPSEEIDFTPLKRFAEK
ncbi:MAG TPA: phosphomannomutase/phosphoglucomutase [Candidatus Onthovicinus excrementipullorum]|nr:phosphomannomutase/phosphoglucomutase [Candidatus Onthovicinus excrementipullorum]